MDFPKLSRDFRQVLLTCTALALSRSTIPSMPQNVVLCLPSRSKTTSSPCFGRLSSSGPSLHATSLASLIASTAMPSLSPPRLLASLARPKSQLMCRQIKTSRLALLCQWYLQPIGVMVLQTLQWVGRRVRGAGDVQRSSMLFSIGHPVLVG